MNAKLGIKPAAPLSYIDPATETVKPGEIQLWKITNNGVQAHALNFHLVNIQVINRISGDGTVRMTDPGELGWKESVVLNPLEDCIIAVKAKVPTYPFTVTNSIRTLNPTMPEGATFASLDPITGNPVTVTNAQTNFGHEFVWQSNMLGYDENDLMRPLVLNVDQSILYITAAGAGIWQWNGTAWSQVNAVSPLNMVAGGSLLYGDFGTGGLWQWNGTAWSQVNAVSPLNMVAGGSLLYGDFGTGGLWQWNGTAWSQVNAVSPLNMVA